MGIPVISSSEKDHQGVTEPRRCAELQFRRRERQSQCLLPVGLSTIVSVKERRDQHTNVLIIASEMWNGEDVKNRATTANDNSR